MWWAATECDSTIGGPELPGYVECCFTPPETWCSIVMRRRYEGGWFAFCCCEPCVEILSDVTLRGDICLPPCQCWPEVVAPCGGACDTDHCEWSFGFEGECGSHLIFIDPSCNKEAIELAFKLACTAARGCACETHNNPEWRRKLSQGAMFDLDYRDVWRCVAEICRTGGITIVCNDPNYCKEGVFGSIEIFAFDVRARTIHLCTDYIAYKGKSIAHYLLHEMLHQCGVALYGPLERQSSAPEWIAERCIDQDGHFSDPYAGIKIEPPSWWNRP
jgi:hypothetical protein